jgi:glycosyltransferase involved in cell wall biosynthesis
MKIRYFTHTHPYKNPITGEMIKEYTGGGVGNVSYNLSVQMAKRGIPIDILYKPLKLGINLDIVHAHAGNPPAPIAAYLYAKKKKKPFVVTYHGDGQWDWGGVIRRASGYFYSKYLLDKILSYADVIISPSEYYINESRVLSKYRDKIVVIPNGINIDEFNINHSKEECRAKLDLSPDDKIILFLGTLSPQKGPDILLKAMPKIIKEVPETGLVFVGSGTMREELERLCKRLGIEKNVTFVGFVGDTFKKAIYYKSSDVLVLPSFSECFPIVNLEPTIGILTFPISEAGNIPLSNLVDILKPISNDLYLITGNDGIKFFKDDAEIRSCGIEHESGKNVLTRIIRYVYTQLKVSYKLARIAKGVDVWIFFIGGDSLVFPMLTAKLLKKQCVLAFAGSSIHTGKVWGDSLVKPLEFLSSINRSLSD